MANRALYSFSTSALTPSFTVNDIALNSSAATNDNIFTTATPFTVTAAGFDGELVGSGASSGADTGFLNDYQLNSALTLNSGNTATITIGGLDDTRTHRIRVSGSFVGSAEVRSVNVAIGGTTLSYIAANADGSGNINDGVEIDATPSAGTITVTITVASGAVGYVSGIDVLELAPFYGFNNLLIVGASIMAQTYDTGTDIVNRFNADYPDAGGWTVYGRAVAGWTTTDLRNNIDAILADYTDVTNMAVLVHTGGNNISLTRPYSSTTLTEQQTITDDVTYICNAIITAGFIPILADVTFRNYADVDPLDAATYVNGSEPYNINLYRPLTLSYSPYFADSNGDSYMSFYYFMLNNYAQYIGSDGIHPTTIGRAALRQRIVDTIGYTAEYNVDPQQLSLDIVQSGGTAQRVYHINYGGDPYGAPETINTIADDSGSLLSLTDVNDASAGYGVTVSNYHPNSPNTAGAASADNTGFLYDTVLAQSFYLQSGVTTSNQISGLDDNKLYNLIVSGSRGGVSGRRTQIEVVTGTGTQAAQDYGTDDGANGANYSDGVTFTDISPESGIIQFNATVSSGSYGYVGGFDLVEQGEVAPVVIGGTATAQTDATVSTQLSNSIASTVSATTNAVLSTALALSISGTSTAQTDSTITTTTSAQIGATATSTTDSALSALITVPISQTASAQTDATLSSVIATSLSATSTATTDSTISTTLATQGNISALTSATTNSTLTTALTTQISSTTTALTNSTISTVLSNTSSLSAALSAQTDSSILTTLATSSLSSTATAQTDSTLTTALSTQITSTSTAQTDSTVSTVLLSANSISATSTAQTNSTITTTTSTVFSANTSAQTDAIIASILSYNVGATATAQTDSTLSTSFVIGSTFSINLTAQTDSTLSTLVVYDISMSSTATTDSTLTTTIIDPNSFDYIMDIDVLERIHDIQIT